MLKKVIFNIVEMIGFSSFEDLKTEHDRTMVWLGYEIVIQWHCCASRFKMSDECFVWEMPVGDDLSEIGFFRLELSVKRCFKFLKRI